MAQFPEWMRKQRGTAVGWRCEDCGRSYKDGWALEFHHILPQNAGGGDTYDNMACVCLFCHYNRHIELRARGTDHPASACLIQNRIKSTGGRTRGWLECNRQ